MIKSEKFNHLHIPWNSKYHIQILNTLSSAHMLFVLHGHTTTWWLPGKNSSGFTKSTKWMIWMAEKNGRNKSIPINISLG